VKMIDSTGEMFGEIWETYASYIVNSDETRLMDRIVDIITKENINIDTSAKVCIAMDTR
jgi:hypothetical protein